MTVAAFARGTIAVTAIKFHWRDHNDQHRHREGGIAKLSVDLDSPITEYWPVITASAMTGSTNTAVLKGSLVVAISGRTRFLSRSAPG